VQSDPTAILSQARLGAPSIKDYDNAEPAPRYGGDFTLNYRKDKWDVSLGASYLCNDISGRRVGNVYTVRNDTLTHFPSDGERSFDEKSYTARATVGYAATSNDNFSLGLYASKRSKDRTADILYYHNRNVYLPEGEMVGQIEDYNENLRIRRGDFFISSLDYGHTFADQGTLSASFLYEYTMLGGPTTNLNLSWPTLLDTLQDQYNTNDNPLHGIRFQLDYSRPLGTGKLETGYQFRHLDHEGDFFYEERIIGTDEYVLNPAFSSQVDLTRQIHSVYGQYSGKWGKLAYIAGLRAEIMDRQLILTNALLDDT
jgi:iron complex outermembrane receptor protein